MNDELRNINIPELRFSEFSEKWSEIKIENIFSIFNGYAFKSSDSTNEGTLWVKIADVGIQKMKDNNLSYLPNSFKDKHSKYLLKKNDYVVALTRPILSGELKIAQINDFFNNSLLNQRVGKIESSENLDYIYYLLQNNRLIKSIENNIAGSDPPNLSPKEINNIKVRFPTSTEQTKIATFLTAVDKRINLLQKKKTELEQYKKGIMQKLFSVQTDNNPSLRFKKEDGSDFEDWKVKMLGEIGETFNGLTGKTKVDFGRGKPYIQYMQIFSNSRIDITNFGLVDVGDDENQSKAQFGDVFFTTSSETPNEIGMSSVLTEQVEDVYLNSFCFGYRPNSLEELVPEFSQYFFRSSKVRKEIIKLAQGSTRFNMSKVAFMKLKFNFPKKEEQQKIANFLSSIDKSIKNISNQIDDSVLFKKGLLQKMFV